MFEMNVFEPMIKACEEQGISVESLESAYLEMSEFRSSDKESFDADESNIENFEGLKNMLLFLKIAPTILEICNEARVKSMVNSAAIADKLVVDEKYRLTSSEMYSMLKSFDNEQLRAIIGTTSDSAEEFDRVIEAISNDDEKAFVKTIQEFDSTKLIRYCCSINQQVTDYQRLNGSVSADEYKNIFENPDNPELIEDMEDNFSEVSLSNVFPSEPNEANSVEGIYKGLKMELCFANMQLTNKSRRKLRKFLNEPMVKEIFDGTKYITESTPTDLTTIKEFLKEYPEFANAMKSLVAVDIDSLLAEEVQQEVVEQEVEAMPDNIISECEFASGEEFSLPDNLFTMDFSYDDSCFRNISHLEKVVKSEAYIFEELVNSIAKMGHIKDDVETKYAFVYQLTGVRLRPRSRAEEIGKINKIIWQGRDKDLLTLAKYLYQDRHRSYLSIQNYFIVDFLRRDKTAIDPNQYSGNADRPSRELAYALYRLYNIDVKAQYKKDLGYDIIGTSLIIGDI